MNRSQVRDRRGRGMRSALFRAPVPASRTRGEDFSRTAAKIFERVRRRAEGELDGVVLNVDAVPRAADEPELGRVFPAMPHRPATILLHRLPIASRCRGRVELAELLADVLAEQAGLLCGRDPDDLRPGGSAP